MPAAVQMSPRLGKEGRKKEGKDGGRKERIFLVLCVVGKSWVERVRKTKDKQKKRLEDTSPRICF